MNSSDLAPLQGASVLVRCVQDRRDPPIALRGSLTLVADEEGCPASIVLEFPEMCATPAHRRVLPLDRDRLARLLASERAGTYEYGIDGPLDLIGPRVGAPPAQMGHPALYEE